jgi:hypothetical protein
MQLSEAFTESSKQLNAQMEKAERNTTGVSNGAGQTAMNVQTVAAIGRRAGQLHSRTGYSDPQRNRAEQNCCSGIINC